MVAVKFWACSKQSHKGRRGGRSLTGRSKEVGWRHTHRRGRRMDAQWSAIGRPVINANIVYQFERHVCLACTTIVPTFGVHWAITLAITVPPFSDHGNTWATMAMVLPSLCLLCATCCATNTPFTQGLRPLCLPCATTKLTRSPLKAEGKPNGRRGRSRVAHGTFRHSHGRHGRREVLSMFKTVAQRSPRRSVAHKSLKGGRMKAHPSPWPQNGCTVVGHWSPSKKWEHCVSIWATRLPSLCHHCASFGRPMASIERSLWRPLCHHSATTATLEPPWQLFCLHSAFFVRPVVPLQQLWSFKEGTRVVLQQLHRKRTFWVPATTERPNHFYGRTKVARRSQPCVKQLWSFKEGTRVVLQQLHRKRTFWVPATTERPNHFYGRTKVARRSQPCVKQLWSFKEGTRVVLQQLHRNRTLWVPATTERPNHFYGRTKVARRLQPCVKGA